MIAIETTWDGVSVGPDERVTLTLTIADGALRVDVVAPFHGDPAPPAPVGVTDGLWEHEVVELFVVGPDGRYTELELGPHGHQLGLRFTAPRVRVDVLPALPFSAGVDGATWRATAQVPLSALPARPWRLNAFAIHGVGASRRYLAATALPGPRPDFHQPARFTLTLV